MAVKRTIEDVFNIEKGVEVSASQFFRQPFDVVTQARAEQELANQQKRSKWLVCAICGENIRILGGKRHDEITKPGKNFHFAHLHNSKDCPIKTTSKFSRDDVNRMRYRGIAEGRPHIELKEKLYQGLNLNAHNKGQVTNLQLERVIRSLDESEWRKPDINLLFNGQRLAVELQLSTTWLDVIVGRQAFYRQEGIFILWVFNEFDYKDTTRKLAFSDIIYTNNYNAFVFDEEARAATLQARDLVLKCYYQHHYEERGEVRSRWDHELVTLDQLTFDQSTKKMYFMDIALEKNIASSAVRQYKALQLKEIQDRRDERNRLRSLRAGCQQELKEVQNKLSTTEKEVRAIERRLLESNRSLQAAQADLKKAAEKSNDVANNLNNLWWSLPKPTDELRKRFSEKAKELDVQLKSLNDRYEILCKKHKYYRNGRAKLINGKEYHVLDRQSDWNYITANANRIMAYRNDQANNLFASPELQPLNNHKVMQMRHTVQVEFVIDLSEDLSANQIELNEVKEKLAGLQQVKQLSKEKCQLELHDSLVTAYTNQIKEYEQVSLQTRLQHEQQKEEAEKLQAASDKLFLDIAQLDYLDDYEDDYR